MITEDFISCIKQDKDHAIMMLNGNTTWEYLISKIVPSMDEWYRWCGLFVVDPDDIESSEFFDFITGNGFKVYYSPCKENQKIYVHVRSE